MTVRARGTGQCTPQRKTSYRYLWVVVRALVALAVSRWEQGHRTAETPQTTCRPPALALAP